MWNTYFFNPVQWYQIRKLKGWGIALLYFNLYSSINSSKLIFKKSKKRSLCSLFKGIWMNLKFWPQQPGKGSGDFFQMLHLIDQIKVMEKMSYRLLQFLIISLQGRWKQLKIRVIVRIWVQSQAIAHFSQCLLWIKKCNIYLIKSTRPLLRSLTSTFQIHQTFKTDWLDQILT